MRQSHEDVVAAHSIAMAKRETLVSSVKSEIINAEKLAKIITEEVVFEAGSSEAGIVGGQGSNDILTMRAEVVKCEAAGDEANQILMSAKAAEVSLVEEIANIEMRLPTLEDKKKTAVSTRDFKMAGKASKEIKEVKARKVTCEEQLNVDVKKRQEAAQAELEKCIKALEEKKSTTHEMEKKKSIEQMELLVRKINRIERIKQEICSGKKEEDFEKEDVSLNVQVVGAHVLDREICVLKAEGEELGKTFGEWNNILSKLCDTNEIKVDSDDGDTNKQSLESSIMDEKDEDDMNCKASNGCKGSSDGEVIEDDDSSVIEGEEKSEDEQANEKQCLDRFQEITLTLKEIATELEGAVENEDYDEAAALDEKLQDLKIELESLGLSEAVMASFPDEQESIISEYVIDEECGKFQTRENEMKENSDDESLISANVTNEECGMLDENIDIVSERDEDEPSECNIVEEFQTQENEINEDRQEC